MSLAFLRRQIQFTHGLYEAPTILHTRRLLTKIDCFFHLRSTATPSPKPILGMPGISVPLSVSHDLRLYLEASCRGIGREKGLGRRVCFSCMALGT